MELKDSQLPDDWQLSRIAEKFAFTNKPRDIRVDDYATIPFVPMDLLPTGRLFFSDFALKSPKDISSGTYFEDGDLLLSKITPCFENGKQGIATSVPGGFGIATTEVIPIKAIDSVSYLPFLALYLLHADVRNQLAGKMEGATGRQRLAKSVLEEWTMPFPPLPEQRAIAAVLSKIQAAAELQEKIVATLKQLKAATMAKLFREGLRGEPARSETRFGQVPQEWEIELLTEHAYVQTGVAKGRKIDNSSAIELPYLRVANVQDGYLDLSEIKTIRLRETERERYSLQVDDVLLTEGGDFDKLGRGYLWKGQIKNCVHQNHIFAVRTDRKTLLPEFFVYLVQSPYGKAYFLSVAHKTTNLACINSHKLKAFPILLPSLSEQRKIAAILGGIDERIGQETNRLTAFKHLFSSMLHLLITGQLRVKNLIKEMAPQSPTA